MLWRLGGFGGAWGLVLGMIYGLIYPIAQLLINSNQHPLGYAELASIALSVLIGWLVGGLVGLIWGVLLGMLNWAILFAVVRYALFSHIPPQRYSRLLAVSSLVLGMFSHLILILVTAPQYPTVLHWVANIGAPILIVTLVFMAIAHKAGKWIGAHVSIGLNL